MNLVLLLSILVSTTAFGREVRSELQIIKGPFYVPVQNEMFNPLGPDYKSQGVALVYVTPTTIDFKFSRTQLRSYNSVQDGDYFYSPKKGAGVQVGFEGEKLSWFYSRSNDWDANWDVRISEKARKELVAPTPFSQMTHRQLLDFVTRAVESSGAGDLGDIQIRRLDNAIIVYAKITQEGEEEEQTQVVGTAVITFVDEKNSRSIHLQATVEDRKDNSSKMSFYGNSDFKWNRI